MRKHSHLTLPVVVPMAILLIMGTWYVLSPTTTEAEIKNTPFQKETLPVPQEKPYGDYFVVVHLDTNTVILHDGNKKIILNIISQGKPGSYFETIGGAYASDYKEPLHFSSIGHVYMPFSIHIFGNYFIHGIPYYPNGAKVSSAYSGGCVRLADADVELLYNFITPTTPIIITRGGDHDFRPTATTTPDILSGEMTRLMVATISLELLTQDNEIYGTNGVPTTRKKLLPRLLNNTSTAVSTLYSNSLGKEAFIEAMNNKAKVLGMTNTNFVDIQSPVQTTEEDSARFMDYITTYKSYLQQF